MFNLKKTKKAYKAPLTVVTQADLEGLICASVRFNIQVDELDNVNADTSSDEVFYFES